MITEKETLKYERRRCNGHAEEETPTTLEDAAALSKRSMLRTKDEEKDKRRQWHKQTSAALNTTHQRTDHPNHSRKQNAVSRESPYPAASWSSSLMFEAFSTSRP